MIAGFVLAILVATSLFFSAPSQAQTGPCTKGVNCYCDKVAPGGSLADPLLLWCEDWDNPDYYLNTANNWVASSANGPSGVTNRGNISRFSQVYGNGVGQGLWSQGQPANPRIGTTCGFGLCVGQKVYCGTAQGNLVDGQGADCWGPGGNAGSFIHIQAPGDVNAEVGGLTLTGGNNGTVFSGNYNWAYRICAGLGCNAGITGSKSWSAKTEIGITMALAYASNVVSSGILNGPWKHDEWGSTNQHWNLGLTGSGGLNVFPYSPFMWHTGQAACQTALNNASLLRGTADCSSVALRMGASSSFYNQATNFPFGTWGCHQAHISGLGTSNTTVRLWHNEVLIFHLANFNGTSLVDQSFGSVVLNAYANTNQPGGGGTTQTTYRYQDNVHVRNGAPVSCAQIGFTPVNRPSAPMGVQVK